MLNSINKHTNKYHILVGIFTFVVILSLILMPILSTPKSQESLIKTPKEFTKIVNIDLVSSVSVSSLFSSSILQSSLSSLSSIIETPKLTPQVVEETKLETPKPIISIPAQKIEIQNNLETPTPTPKPKPPVITPSQTKIIEVIKPTVEVDIESKIVEQPAPKPQPITEQPKVVASSLFSASGCNSSLASQMLVFINNHRAENNAKPLSLSGQLDSIACAHSKWMTETGTFSHAGRDATNPFERCQKAGTYCYAENVAYNTIPNVKDLFEQFKTSPGHNINMLDPNFVEVGLAFDGIYVTQIFR
jgi:uncharacterized protein YkwD